MEIGQNALQGLDYYYTLQGWLKGVNSSVLNDENDPGMDSDPSEINALFAKDVFGFSLDYYANDYTAINGATPLANVQNTSHAAQNSADLYNGNIRFMQTALTNPLDRAKMPMLNAYKYDQLNRLKESRSYENGLSGNTWNPTSYKNECFNAFTYDAMGNVLTQARHNRAGQKFDDLAYHYQTDPSGKVKEIRRTLESTKKNLIFEYAYKMSNVRAVSAKQNSFASYIPFIGNVLNASALAQKAEDPTMKIDAGDIASIALGAYFKGTRKVIKASGALVGARKTALRVSEEFTTLVTNIATSPDLKESWVELAVMQHFANQQSEGGNKIGQLYGDDEGSYTTTFRFNQSFISELEENFGKEFDNLKDKSGLKREDYINSKVEGHLKGMFEDKKSEIMKELDK